MISEIDTVKIFLDLLKSERLTAYQRWREIEGAILVESNKLAEMIANEKGFRIGDRVANAKGRAFTIESFCYFRTGVVIVMGGNGIWSLDELKKEES